MIVTIIRRPDGCISINHPFVPKGMDVSTPEWAEHVQGVTARALKQCPRGSVVVGQIDEMDLPRSRYFRNQWRHDGERVAVDMALARSHKMALIRAERNKRLVETDALALRAVERKEPDTALESVRQALRDVPQSIDLEAIKTPDELEEFQPQWP